MPNSESGPRLKAQGKLSDSHCFLEMPKTYRGRKACFRAGNVAIFLVHSSLCKAHIGVIAGQVGGITSPFCGPMALEGWGLAGVQHSIALGNGPGHLQDRGTKGSSRPTTLIVLVWPLSTGLSSFYPGKLCCKVLARGMRQDMGGGY